MRIILTLLLGFSPMLQVLAVENPLPSALNVDGVTEEYIQTLRRVDDEAGKISKLNRQQLSKRVSTAEAEIEQLEQEVQILRNEVKDIERRIKEFPSTADALDKANKRLAKLALRGFREIPKAVTSNTEKRAKVSISRATELTQAYADQLKAIENDEILRDLREKLAARKSALDQSELSLY